MDATQTAPATDGTFVTGAGVHRLLHVIAPAPVGGAERVVRLLAVEQARAGADVHVAAVLIPGDAEDHPFVRQCRSEGLHVHTIVAGARRYMREYRQVSALCGRLRPDVVHTHGFRSDVVDAAAARARGVPVIATVHGFIGNTLRGRLYERIQRHALRKADAVIAVSRPQVQQLVAAGVMHRHVHLVPNAYDAAAPRLTRAEARARLGLAPDAFVAGWVGRLGEEKAPDVLVEATARLKPAGVRVSFVGDGRMAAMLQLRAAALGVDDAITWHGAQDNAGALLAAFDVFVLSSRTEGTPMVLLEAMAAGVPIITTEVGGVPDVVTPAEAVLVPSGDSDALAAAVLRVSSDPDAAAERARRAGKRLERYGIAAWIRAHAAVYAAAAANR